MTLPLQSILTKSKSLVTRRKEAREKEINKLMRCIKKMQLQQYRQPKGVGDLTFTVGSNETNGFKAEQELRRARGDTYFVRAKKVSC